MNAAELDTLLRQFLVDDKLNTSEKKALADWVKTNIVSDQQRGVARSRVFDAARDVVVDTKAQAVLSFVEEVLRVIVPMNPGGSVPVAPDQAYFSPGDGCLAAILNRINTAKRSIDICVFTITDDRVTSAILAALKRGIAIRIITDNEKSEDAGSDIERLEHAGIPVRMDKSPYHMHHKFAIFDGTRLVNGSYNWTRNAAEVNQENIVDTGEMPIVVRFQQEFDRLWSKLA